MLTAEGRHVTPDIDPTFPDEPPTSPIQLPEWAPASPTDEEVWLRTGAVKVPAGLWSPDEIQGVTGGWLLAEGFLEHRRDGRKVFGFFRTLLLDQREVDTAITLARELKYPGNHFFPELPAVQEVFAGEMPWSTRLAVHYDADDSGQNPHPALSRNWQEEGIRIDQVAVSFSTPGESATALAQSYDVPSFEFAAQFGLRQLPGTLDLVGLDGAPASAIFRATEPWYGQVLFLRRDLIAAFAGDRRIVQVAWGEREVTVEWSAVPQWVRAAQQAHEHVWREIREIDGDPPPRG